MEPLRDSVRTFRGSSCEASPPRPAFRTNDTAIPAFPGADSVCPTPHMPSATVTNEPTLAPTTSNATNHIATLLVGHESPGLDQTAPRSLSHLRVTPIEEIGSPSILLRAPSVRGRPRVARRVGPLSRQGSGGDFMGDISDTLVEPWLQKPIPVPRRVSRHPIIPPRPRDCGVAQAGDS